eukprot:gene26497-34697_t
MLVDTPRGRIVKPTGFVFHESRVGSTLVANSLASDPWSMVFSESAPTANALLHCNQCSKDIKIKIFRDVVTLMGNSPFHKRMFFKFQSIVTTEMEIVLEAFPDTPWAFVYRQPVQTMMSHLDPRKGNSGAPCLRSMRNPPEAVKKTISSLGSSKVPKEAWCAAHLNMLCSSALNAYENFRSYDSINNPQDRGLFINYESLPGSVVQVMLPFFRVVPHEDWINKIKEESQVYSKGKSQTKPFTSDSEDKDSHATPEIIKFAHEYLLTSFKKMEGIAYSSVKKLISSVSLDVTNDGIVSNWKTLSTIQFVPYTIPTININPSSVQSHLNEYYKKHSNLKKIEYQPWAPFANSHSSVPFEVVNCPITPDQNYPIAYPILDLLNNWNTDVTDIPSYHYDSICHFDYNNKTELDAAYAYRKADVPFIMYNIPELDKVVKKWSNIDYIHRRLGTKSYRTETSKDNHFMYWRGYAKKNLKGSDGKPWSPPTDVISITFEKWLEIAVKGQNSTLEDRTHQYFRVSSDQANMWLFDELPFFKPAKSLFLVDPTQQRGIHCRFGMRSVIAEAHFDGSWNSVVMLGGLRRWILASPNQCKNMHMLKHGHPSSRHSAVDWSKPNITLFPNFPKIQANEVILQPGDYLYVPTYWIHYIISLNINYQCNTRSGKSKLYDEDINECGF